MRRRSFLVASAAGLGSLFAGCSVGPLGSPTSSPTQAPPDREWQVELDAQPFLVRFALGGEYVYYTVGSNLYPVALEDGLEVGAVDISDFGLSKLDAFADAVLLWTAEGVAMHDAIPASEPRWRRPNIQDGAVVSPTRLVGTDDEAFTSVALADGAVEWDRPAPGVATDLLAWTDETLVTSGLDDGTVTLWGLARSDGGTRWRVPLPRDTTTYVPTVAAGDAVYRGSNGFGPGRVLALDPADGGVLWERSLGDGFATPVGTLGDALLAQRGRSVGNELVALGVADGGRRWSTPVRRVVDLGAEFALVLDVEGRFAVVDPDGTVRWRLDVTAPGTDEADDRQRTGTVGDVVVLQAGARFVGADPADGAVRWRYDHDRPVRRWWDLGDAVLLWDGQLLASVPVS